MIQNQNRDYLKYWLFKARILKRAHPIRERHAEDIQRSNKTECQRTDIIYEYYREYYFKSIVFTISYQ